jgi:hypothetical protein
MSAPTRRAILGAIAAAPAVGMVSNPAPAAALDATAWGDALNALVKSSTDLEAFIPIHNAAWKTFLDNQPSPDMIDWRPFLLADRRHLLHAADLDEMEAKFIAGEGKWWWGASIKERQLKSFAQLREFRRLYAEVEAPFDEIEEQWSALVTAEDAAEVAVFQAPAPHLAALRWKLERLFGEGARGPDRHGDSHGPERLDPVMADIARLAGEA